MKLTITLPLRIIDTIVIIELVSLRACKYIKSAAQRKMLISGIVMLQWNGVVSLRVRHQKQNRIILMIKH